MTKVQRAWSWSAIAFVITAAILGALVERATNRIADRVEQRFGYTPDPQGTREFLAELEHPTFGQAAEEATAKVAYRDTFAYRHVDRAHQAVYGAPWKSMNQGNAGTCVSFAFSLAARVGQSCDWVVGRMPMPPPEIATEPIYAGSRTLGRLPPLKVPPFGNETNPGGDGSYGAAAARWVAGLDKLERGGILYRQTYGSFDLRDYSIQKSRDWGRTGVPDELAKCSFEHRALAVAQVNDWASLCAALESGYGVVLCSSVGYGGTNVTDADGFLPRGSSWSHAMCVTAVRHAANAPKDGTVRNPRDGALIQNSWGENWVRYAGRWPADQPAGSFWAERRHVEAALAQGDCFAVGGVDGFRYRDIDNGAWLEPAPPAPLESAEIRGQPAFSGSRKLAVSAKYPASNFSLAQ